MEKSFISVKKYGKYDGNNSKYNNGDDLVDKDGIIYVNFFADRIEIGFHSDPPLGLIITPNYILLHYMNVIKFDNLPIVTIHNFLWRRCRCVNLQKREW